MQAIDITACEAETISAQCPEGHMRETPIPPLRDLAPGLLVVRCGVCMALVYASELCQRLEDTPTCVGAWSDVPRTLCQLWHLGQRGDDAPAAP
jgi:hypothetical protein